MGISGWKVQGRCKYWVLGSCSCRNLLWRVRQEHGVVECLAYYVVGMTNSVVLVFKSDFHCDADVLVRLDFDNR